MYTRWSSNSLAKLVYKSNNYKVFTWYIYVVNAIITHLQLGGHHLVAIEPWLFEQQISPPVFSKFMMQSQTHKVVPAQL